MTIDAETAKSKHEIISRMGGKKFKKAIWNYNAYVTRLTRKAIHIVGTPEDLSNTRRYIRSLTYVSSQNLTFTKITYERG